MKYILSFILISAFFLASAQSDTLAHTLLWKISGRGLSFPSYLYGTMHSGDDRVFKLMDSALIGFDASQVFAMEINMDSVNNNALAAEMLLPEGQTLKELLGKDDYKLAGKY